MYKYINIKLEKNVAKNSFRHSIGFQEQTTYKIKKKEL